MQSLDGLDPTTVRKIHAAARVAAARGMPVCEASNGSGYLVDIAKGPLGLINREYWDPARLNEHAFNLMNGLRLNVFHVAGTAYAMPSDVDTYGDMEARASHNDHKGSPDAAMRHAILALCEMLDGDHAI